MESFFGAKTTLVCYLENGHLFPMHWLFCVKKLHSTFGLSISMPKCAFTKSTAERIEIKESRLQHLGPPISPILLSDSAVIRCERAKGLFFNGVDSEMIEINMPELMPAPQAPQKPQDPPGTRLPRLIISTKALCRSITPPALEYAVKRAAPTITWCSGPCIWQNGSFINFSMISTGSLERSAMQRLTMEVKPLE